ncbi:hypothetical protein JB92DRAFT_3147931 [Gautieria morchelliformis]|nr:hypothetical protein JB92DRAFT_3147931 [Gautieria morchelliformis]
MPSKKSKLHKKKQEEGGAGAGAGAGVANGRSEGAGAGEGDVRGTPPPGAEEADAGIGLAPTPPADAEPDPRAAAAALKEQGNAAFKAKHFGDAIDLYTRAIDLHPTEPTYLTNRAACNMALHRFRPALHDCQAAAALQAQQADADAPAAGAAPKTLVRLAKCHLALGAPGAALAAARRGGKDAKDAREVEHAAQRMEAHLARVAGARARRDWGHARLALDAAARECAGGEPLEWRCWRVELELARGRWAAAMDAANEAFQLDKTAPDVLCARGLVLFLAGRLPAAAQHAQQALAYDPDDARARKLLRRARDVERLKEDGNAQFKAGRLAEAVELYGAALGTVEARAEEGGGGAIRAKLLSNRAMALLKLGRREAALADTNASLGLVGTSYKALRTRARISMAQEEYAGAVTDLNAALEHARTEGSAAEERGLKEELRAAEVALKRSKTKDYYKILDIPKDSTEHDIKKAYRKQSLVHHPDKGGDEEKFKLASEAYNVLSDPQKRARYDAGEDAEQGMGMGPGGMGGMSQAELSEILSQFGGGGGGFSFGFGGGPMPRGHTHSGGGFPF